MSFKNPDRNEGAETNTASSKIISLEEFKNLRLEFKEKGLKLVHCHGVFDLLHPGHIGHLQQAKSAGDILLVSITSAEYVLKGPGRPYFSDEQRMNSVAALSCVDYVIMAPFETALEILDAIQPDLYIKGSEYEDSSNDITRNIGHEIEKVRSYGGDVRYTGGPAFSSTKLLNRAFPVIPPDARMFIEKLSSHYSFSDIQTFLEQMHSIKILVIGDIIIDQYIFCTVQGMSVKDRALSALYERKNEFPGGSLAIARHLAQFSQNVRFCGIAGDDPGTHRILNGLKGEVDYDIRFVPEFRTVVKRRYIERRGIRKDFDKLFAINYIQQPGEINRDIGEEFYRSLNVPEYDLVLISDFGHGTVDQKLMETVQDQARFLAVNCQTNTANYGNNLISKYHRADTFTLDERELKLVFPGSTDSIETLIQHLSNRLQAGIGWVTLGSRGAVGWNKNYQTVKAPALTLQVQDTVGAGDAFFALAGLCAAARVPLEVAAFLGSIAGALAANILGNSKPVERISLLKYASTLMNY